MPISFDGFQVSALNISFDGYTFGGDFQVEDGYATLIVDFPDSHVWSSAYVDEGSASNSVEIEEKYTVTDLKIDGSGYQDSQTWLYSAEGDAYSDTMQEVYQGQGQALARTSTSGSAVTDANLLGSGYQVLNADFYNFDAYGRVYSENYTFSGDSRVVGGSFSNADSSALFIGSEANGDSYQTTEASIDSDTFAWASSYIDTFDSSTMATLDHKASENESFAQTTSTSFGEGIVNQSLFAEEIVVEDYSWTAADSFSDTSVTLSTRDELTGVDITQSAFGTFYQDAYVEQWSDDSLLSLNVEQSGHDAFGEQRVSATVDPLTGVVSGDFEIFAGGSDYYSDIEIDFVDDTLPDFYLSVGSSSGTESDIFASGSFDITGDVVSYGFDSNGSGTFVDFQVVA